MGCDYIADKDGFFKAEIIPIPGSLSFNYSRTIEIKGEPYHSVYKNMFDYNSDTEEVFLITGSER